MARYFCRILIKFEFSRHIFEKVSNIKFRQNPSSGSRVVTCGQTDMTKLRGAFGNYANVPKKKCLWILSHASGPNDARYGKTGTTLGPTPVSVLFLKSCEEPSVTRFR
jgi:hypothetical protein